MPFVCPPEHNHASTGKLTCYAAHGCRCDDCGELSREYSYWRDHMNASGHELTISSRGTQRRIQALMCLGWSMHQIAIRLNDRRGNLRRLLLTDTITRKRATRIAAVYDEMSMTRPEGTTRPEIASIARIRVFARRNGWVPPLAWDDIDNDEHPAIVDHVPYATQIDTVAVDLALRGSRAVRLTPAERRVCVQQLHSRRWSDKAIATLIGCSEKTVGRIRDELGLPAWDDAEQLTTREELAA